MSYDNEEWQAPKEFPRLEEAEILAYDTETKDPDLLTRGPGGVTRNGHIIGFSLATPDGYRGYFPIRHEGGGNLDPENTLAWLRDVMARPMPKVAANWGYDAEWLRTENIEVAGQLIDVQIAEPLLDENKYSYSLDALSQAYLGESKDESLLIAAALAHGIPEKEAKSQMYKLHSKWVGPYGEKDADLPLRIWEKQKVRIEEEELQHVFDLESELVRVILDMRWQGVHVDLERAEVSYNMLLREQEQLQYELDKMAGCGVDIWSGVSIARACDSMNLPYPRTAKGNPSFESDWLETQEGVEFYKKLLTTRQLDRAGAVFIKSKIIDIAHNGKIYPRFRQVRGDDKGTRSGRLSSEGPNLQQVPARNERLAKIIRSLFIPRPGENWGSLDWSQQEPRVTVHYAYKRGFAGAAEARQRYIDNPKTDYHQLTADMIYDFTGMRVDRKLVAKPINLGAAYGMGKKKLAETLGLTEAEANPILRAYHRGVPYVKLLGDDAAAVASERGYIRTISGRRRHFDLFGPRGWKQGVVPKKYQEAIEEWGVSGVVRYFTHKALNALVQGTAADMMKYAMVEVWRRGYTPLMTIHDELCFSLGNQKQLREIYDVMIDPMPGGRRLEVPLQIDVEWGPSWGEAEEIEDFQLIKPEQLATS